MSLLGLDVGTTGCKARVFSEDGRVLAGAYREYDVQRPQPGASELDAQDVWTKVQEVIREAAAGASADPVTALSVTSMGEAMVPVDADRRILGPSILADDSRGAEFLPELADALDPLRFYEINGNTLGNHYSLTKLLWIRKHRPQLFDKTDRFLLWGSFVPFMLGADPVVDYSLANRTLLFDLNAEDWSDELLGKVGLDAGKLARPAPSGTDIGLIDPRIADELGLPRRVTLVTGAHDQCANALGCGAVTQGRAMLGMGTYHCITPAFPSRPPAEAMLERGLNTEHHSVPGLFVSFIYNQGGSFMKWYRNTFAAADHEAAQRAGDDVYPILVGEMPAGPSSVLVLPHFTATGPPDFITDSRGVLLGLRLDTSRGDILKGILESIAFCLRQCVDALPEVNIPIEELRVVGGGSKADAWVQLYADVLDRPLVRPSQTEAGAMGAALLAGSATGVFTSAAEGAEAWVQIEDRFEPNPERVRQYDARYAQYRKLWPTLKNYIGELVAAEVPSP